MASIPSIWELLLPNLFSNAGDMNTTVLIGIIMIAILVLDSVLLAGTIFTSLGRILSVSTNGRVNPVNIRIYFVLTALILIYAVSIFQDFTETTAGTLILIGGLGIVAYIITLLTDKDSKKDSNGKSKKRLKL